ncbi:MAG: vitamin K epoxide reductase family protein [Gaiellaceae bacterium]
MSDRTLRVAIGALALVGAAIAAYLTVVHFTHNQAVCPTSGCETVQRSRYSELAGIPVAALGLVAYVPVAATAASARREAAVLAAATALVALVFSAYLLAVSLFVIHAVCVWCVGTDVVVVLLAPAAIARVLFAR